MTTAQDGGKVGSLTHRPHKVKSIAEFYWQNYFYKGK